MRQRTKVSVVCSANPLGQKHLSRKEVLRNKFNSGNITTEELREYSCFFSYESSAAVDKTPKFVITIILGNEAKVPYNEFITRWEPCDFKNIKTIY